MTGPNQNYEHDVANIMNVEYAPGWEAIGKITIASNETDASVDVTNTVHTEIEATVRKLILEPNVTCRVSFTKVATDIDNDNDLVLIGVHTFIYRHEIIVPRGIVDDPGDTIWLNILSYDTSTGSCICIKG